MCGVLLHTFKTKKPYVKEGQTGNLSSKLYHVNGSRHRRYSRWGNRLHLILRLG